MIYNSLRDRLPAWLADWTMHFEAEIERCVAEFAGTLESGALVLDAGAGESRHAAHFSGQHYIGVDLGIGDSSWNYSTLDALSDLTALPFRNSTFDAAINIVTLEHVRDPAAVLTEISRVMKPGARLLIVTPHEWEEHQAPHDYFRYTRYGLLHLLEKAGFRHASIQPVGGFFRLLARRMLNALQFFPGPSIFIAAIFFVPPALVLPILDPLDRKRNFTLGYICTARRC